ncbi:GyrI-like domain-containing protein [Planococcus sp. CAU13]|uniref:GyrI-like domain-containing protein n=1 Tax=Planococcus sp. CAU13 TaxID=1541197 RepID=UPI0005300289|nr:GyrI-like domain-containing protein [Planococcus sp. CAU13]
MKHEWRKAEKEYYLPPSSPVLSQIPKQRFFAIQGKGNPNGEDFAKRIEVLYSLAYAIRMMPKNGFMPHGYYEYTVYPLEAVWSLTEKGKQLDHLDKDEFLYTLMIRQPDFVDNGTVVKAFEIANQKEPNELLNEVVFEEFEEGLCVQILHEGPYDDEPDSFERIHRFLEENDLHRRSKKHREIYLNDFRKTAPAKLKTVLRCQVETVMP